MSTVFDKRPWWQRAATVFMGFDGPLALAIVLLAAAGLLTMYSAGYDHGTRFVDHGRNMLLAAGVMFIVAQLSPQRLAQLAVPLYVLGVALLIGVELFGVTKKGATRWLDLQVLVIQPSELLKIATPLMLAWWFQRREGQLQAPDFVVAFVLLAVPVALIVKQPDLGTAILVLSGGLYVMFFAGLSWALILPVLGLGAIGIGGLVWFQTQICEPGVDWVLLHEYQKHRV